MKKMLLAMMILMLSLASHAGDKGNGGDVFDYSSTGEGYKFFDAMEYGESFEPKSLPEFKMIQEQLDDLKVIAPNTVSFLEQIFSSYNILWSFVEPNLVDSPPTGESKLILTKDRVQAALSDVKKQTIQINQKVWNGLSPKSRAFLILHEALWFTDRSEVAFLILNPEAKMTSRYTCSSQGIYGREFSINKSDSATKEDKIHEYVSNLVCEDMMTSTSADIRRQTGFLMGKNFKGASLGASKQIARFICNNSSQYSGDILYTIIDKRKRKEATKSYRSEGYRVNAFGKNYFSTKAPLCTLLSNE